MGTFLQMSLEDKFKEHSIEKADFDEFPNGRDIPYIKDHLLQPVIDYRDVIILRNIYDSLISGYLYHKSESLSVLYLYTSIMSVLLQLFKHSQYLYRRLFQVVESAGWIGGDSRAGIPIYFLRTIQSVG